MRPAWRNAAIVLFTLVLLLGGLFGGRVMAITDETRERLREYTELLSLVHERAGIEVTYRDLVFASIWGMLRNLDPHTSFLTAEAYDNMRHRQQESFHGLGILVGMRNGLLTVITPIEGTPASRTGMRAGDVISTIEGEPTESMNIDEAVRRLKGPKGTQVTIEIVRTGLDEPLELTITRDEIPQNTVRYAYMLDEETGYLLISDFNRGTAREVSDALDKLRQQGMQRLLLDLRNNGGGLLDQAVDVADQFLPAGSRIVETRGRTRDSHQVFRASDAYPDLGLPMVVLVNAGTASAAEILTGAIQDHDLGLIVGTPTWGKGLVQTVYSLSYGAGIALTTAQYFTPSGRLIQRDYSSFYDYASHQGAGAGGESEQMVYLTDLGREVYGGGGIAPDITVEIDAPAGYLQFLLARNAFFDFAVSFTAEQAIEDPDWQPGPELVREFRRWLDELDLTTGEEFDEAMGDPELLDTTRRLLQAEIFNTSFGFEARHRVLAEGDPQIQRARELFDDASDLLARRQGLGQPEETTVGS